MKKGALVRDSLDENELGEDQDLVDPDEVVHERLTQDLMQASAEDSQTVTPIGKAWNCRRGQRSS